MEACYACVAPRPRPQYNNIIKFRLSLVRAVCLKPHTAELRAEELRYATCAGPPRPHDIHSYNFALLSQGGVP